MVISEPVTISTMPIRRRHRERLAQVPLRELVRTDWDAVLHASLFVAFGLWGLFGRARYNLLSVLGGVMTVFYLEFIAIGVMLLFAMRINSWTMRRRAYMIYALALGMLGLLLFWLNRSPFSLLAMAFAMQGVITVRLLGNQDRVFALASAFKERADHEHSADRTP